TAYDNIVDKILKEKWIEALNQCNDQRIDMIEEYLEKFSDRRERIFVERFIVLPVTFYHIKNNPDFKLYH
ncbi:15209_t:CDS:2, partial [Dentiscutata heterogama]